MSSRLGCIADDFTGASDLAGMLVKFGMRTVLVLDTSREARSADAIVVALKSRTSLLEDAVGSSRVALAGLRTAECSQFFFKRCPTFDSTSQDNIGPVAEALMEALGLDFTIACPAFPDHPPTPMTDARRVRGLAAQSHHSSLAIAARRIFPAAWRALAGGDHA